MHRATNSWYFILLSWYIDITACKTVFNWKRAIGEKEQQKSHQWDMGNKETKNEVPPEVAMTESDEYLLDPPTEEPKEPNSKPEPDRECTENDKLADDM